MVGIEWRKVSLDSDSVIAVRYFCTTTWATQRGRHYDAKQLPSFDRPFSDSVRYIVRMIQMYAISVSQNGQSWTIFRRYKQFKDLDANVRIFHRRDFPFLRYLSATNPGSGLCSGVACQ